MIISLKNNLFDDNDISVDILRVGQEYCNPQKKIEDVVRPCYSLHFVMFGRGLLVDTCGREYKIGKSEVFIMYENEKYKYYPDKKDPWSYIWVNFTGKYVDKVLAACGLSRENIRVRITDYEIFTKLMRDMYEAFDASETQQIKISSYFLLMIDMLITQARASLISPSVFRKKRLMREILIYINNNFTSTFLSNQTIARENGISVRGVSLLFKEMLDMSPVEYINKYKISVACERLQDGITSISDVAHWVGIEDEKYFSRVFKNIMGITPQEYSKSGSSDDPFLWIKEKGMFYR